ncbi:uncharacterized protein BDR25DRAFT_351369 [Lindgomyces ingoldianus]|uniref:Uncharacterized protein n=1 Tax=Lindgomyces ingoldianus TaxID=673940 RepID=A0ACB6R736_9PLEO|nr:uncharacterized protein BDR25DRAFT_351369 [Lindgomyces ingoldianus]KAF2474870.1 hypothetical protein BDR25DRAFT_351369 [Lindgomyces ingoldianus]
MFRKSGGMMMPSSIDNFRANVTWRYSASIDGCHHSSLPSSTSASENDLLHSLNIVSRSLSGAYQDNPLALQCDAAAFIYFLCHSSYDIEAHTYFYFALENQVITGIDNHANTVLTDVKWAPKRTSRTNLRRHAFNWLLFAVNWENRRIDILKARIHSQTTLWLFAAPTNLRKTEHIHNSEGTFRDGMYFNLFHMGKNYGRMGTGF